MTQSQNVASGAVSGLNPLSYLNQNQPATVLYVRQSRAPTTTDRRYKLGTIWGDTTNDVSYQLGSIVNAAAQWIVLGPGTSDVDQMAGDSGTATPAAGVITIAGGTGVTTSAAGSTVTINAAAGQAPITEFVVDAGGSADYTTVQAGINAANSAGGGLVFVRPGTFTEDLTLFDNITIWGDSEFTTTIAGTHTPPASGNVNFFRLTLSDATAIFSTAAASSVSLVIEDSTFSVTNGFAFDLVNWTGSIFLNDIGNTGTNDGFINNTGGGNLFLFNGTFGMGTGQTMITSGTVEMFSVDVFCPVSFQTGSSVTIDVSFFEEAVTLANNATGTIYNSRFSAGAASAITMSSSGNWKISGVTIDSSNAGAIAGSGAGTLTLGQLSFMDSAVIATTLTLDPEGREAPMTRYVVDGSGEGDYVTVQAAITAANAAGGGGVFIRPGSFTEDLTLFDGVDLWCAPGSVTIAGTHIPPASGTVNVTGFILSDATAIFSSAAAGTTVLTLSDCFISVTNGFIFDLVNWTGELLMDNCGESSTDDGVVNNTGGVLIKFINSEIGAGTGQTMTLTGNANVRFDTCNINCPVNIAGSGTLTIQNGVKFASTLTIGGSKVTSSINSSFQGAITFSGSSSGSMYTGSISSGAAAALTMSSSGGWILSDLAITSSNSPAVDGAGAGTLTIGALSFQDNSEVAATLTTSLQETLTGTSLATTFDTNVVAAAVTLTGTTLAADGTDANITLTATPKGTGSFTVSSGNLVLGAVATQVEMNGGAATDFIGQATLTAGVVTISNTNIATTDRILLARSAVNASTAIGQPVTSISAATSFTITSVQDASPGTTETNDVSTFDYVITREN